MTLNHNQPPEQQVFKIELHQVTVPKIKNQEHHLHKNKTSTMNQTSKQSKTYSPNKQIQTDHAHQNSNHKRYPILKVCSSN